MLCPRLTKRGASPGLREMGLGNLAGRRRIVVGESIILTGNEGDGHGALQGMCGQSGFGGLAVSAVPD